MEVTFAKEYSAILKDLLHYLGYRIYYLLVRLNGLFHPLGIGGLTKLSALGGENLHLSTEEATLPLNNHYKMSRKPKDGQLITSLKIIY